MSFQPTLSPEHLNKTPSQSSLIKRQAYKTLSQPQTAENPIFLQKLVQDLQFEQAKTQKLQVKLQEKERIIAELQDFIRMIRTDYERNQKELMLLLDDKNQNIELNEIKIESLQKRLENERNPLECNSKINITPVNKSKASDIGSTKASFHASIAKSGKSHRNLNFDAVSSDFFEKKPVFEALSSDFFEKNTISKRPQHQEKENLFDFRHFLNELFSQILALLSVNYLDEIEPKLRSLLQKIRVYEQFHECLGKAIMDCSPEGIWKGVPSVKQQWKWVKNMMLDYVTLKKSEKKFAMSLSQFISPKFTQRIYEENDQK